MDVKKILKFTLVAAFFMTVGWNVYYSQQTEKMSNLTLNNMEALASSTEYEPGNECSGCIMNSLYICKDFGWGGCVGDPDLHYS